MLTPDAVADFRAVSLDALAETTDNLPSHVYSLLWLKVIMLENAGRSVGSVVDHWHEFTQSERHSLLTCYVYGPFI